MTKRRSKVWPTVLLVGTLGLASGEVATAATTPATRGPAASDENGFTYGTPAFRALVQDSYTVTHATRLSPFETWWERGYARTPGAQLPGHAGLTWRQAVALRRQELAAERDPARRVALERDTAAWLHRAVKAIIPKFSLERGFEFANTVRLGERQCLLQSALISGMLRQVGLNAGLAMVWKNERGQESNLGHVVSVLRLTGGRDLLVDASDKAPFMRHEGLLLRDVGAGGAYRFVEPRYAEDDSIVSYAAGGRTLSPSGVRPLGDSYVRSQFDYYRGERAPRGFMGPSTPAGLADSARFLERAVRLSPENPLAALVLGHVYRKQGKVEAARRQYEAAYVLYQRAGHVPAGVTGALDWARSEAGAGGAKGSGT